MAFPERTPSTPPLPPDDEADQEREVTDPASDLGAQFLPWAEGSALKPPPEASPMKVDGDEELTDPGFEVTRKRKIPTRASPVVPVVASVALLAAVGFAAKVYFWDAQAALQPALEPVQPRTAPPVVVAPPDVPAPAPVQAVPSKPAPGPAPSAERPPIEAPAEQAVAAPDDTAADRPSDRKLERNLDRNLAQNPEHSDELAPEPTHRTERRHRTEVADPVAAEPAAATADTAPDHDGASAAPGTLILAINPWANVTLDDRPLGQTPLSPPKLSPGPHHVILMNPELGRTEDRTVFIESGKSTMLKVNLQER